MLFEFFKFEIKYKLKHISTYVFGILLFGLGFLIMNIAGGAFSNMSVIIMGSGGERILLNSSNFMIQITGQFFIFFVFIAAALMSDVLGRDLDYKTYPFYFSKPINKWAYVSGRFFANFFILAIYSFMLFLGKFIVYYLPWIEKESFMSPIVAHYLSPILVFIIPNFLLLSAILLSILLLTRKSIYLYISCFVIIAIYIVSRTYISDIANRVVAALIDPFGLSAVSEMTRLWSASERNINIVTPTGLLLLNRVIWIGFSILILVLSCYKFGLSWLTKEVKQKKTKLKKIAGTTKPVINKNYGCSCLLKQYLSILNLNLKLILKSVPFYILALLGIGTILLIAGQQGRIYNTITYPLTYNIAETISGSITLLMLIIITIYIGEIVWRNKENKLNLIVDSSPSENFVFYLGNFSAIIIAQLILLAVFTGAGIAYQLSRGFSNIELSTYLKIIFGVGFTEFLMYTFLCFFIHTIVSNKYTGHFTFIGLFLILPFSSQIGVYHHLLNFASAPGIRYSDMSGLGPNIIGFVWLRLYWLLFSLIIAYLTVTIMKRGYNDLKFYCYLKKIKSILLKPLFIFLCSTFILTGLFIYYNTNIVNTYTNPKQNERLRAEFEKKFQQFADLPQPKITDVKINVDIFPEQRDVFFQGSYELTNKESYDLNEAHIIIPLGATDYKIDFSAPVIIKDKNQRFGYYIYDFINPLRPGEKITMLFELELVTSGFSHNENMSITKNGTFIHSTVLPTLGYNRKLEIDSPRTRRRYGLPEKERFRGIDDPNGLTSNLVSADADWISFEAIISTSPEQIALTSGDLIEQWNDNNRNYFHYRVDGKILNYFAFMSAKYSVKRDKWNDVDIEVYYHYSHDYNIDHMIKAVKNSLEYFSENYSPYQHNVLRIAEFPRYGTFAQSFPTLIPFSESIGFIAEVRPDRVNYPFFVTSHEVAHQWWGHQLIGADVKGSMMLLEGLTQYSAMMVMKNNFDENLVSRQLIYELTNYLAGRASESREENPLYLDSNQSYIHYHKAAVVLYGLADLLGENLFNNVLRDFIADRSFSDPPYPTSSEFLNYLYSAAPDSLHQFIEDSFEKITIYNNEIIEAIVTENPDRTFTVTIETESHKFYSDGLGNLEPTDINDWVDIVIFTESFRGRRKVLLPVYYQKHLITEKNNTFEITVNRLPVEVGIDPFYKLIDNNPYRNRFIIK